MYNEYMSLCDRFGEENIRCQHCQNWKMLGKQFGKFACLGTCEANCFDLDAPGGVLNTVLLSPTANCYCPSAASQAFLPKSYLLTEEREALSYKHTLRQLDIRLRREAAAW